MDIHEVVKERITQALAAALFVAPLESGLTIEELERIVIDTGISPPVFSEVIQRTWHDLDKDSTGRAILDLARLYNVRRHLRLNFFPIAAFGKLKAAVEALEAARGKNAVKTLAEISSRCSGESPESVRLAIGLAVVSTQLVRRDSGFVRGNYAWNWDEGTIARSDNWPDDWEKPIKALLPRLESLFAGRTGAAVPATSPTDRFLFFIQKQGWSAFAQWWAETTREMREAGDRYPTSTTVLAGALLEAALVAIAEPAKAAGQWNRGFLTGEPRTWQLGQLIDQAEAARTLSGSDAALARGVADLRNRIHAGRFAKPGAGVNQDSCPKIFRTAPTRATPFAPRA